MIDRSSIFRRAWQLARWNANPGNPSDNRGFGHWLRRAWAEWRDHGGAEWSFEAPKPRTASEMIADLETCDRLGIAGLRQLQALHVAALTERRAA